jgi:hypothetical protein
MNEVYHYPNWYYSRRGDSDINMILTLMRNIPISEQKSVSNEYMLKFDNLGRIKANEWLKGRCK